MNAIEEIAKRDGRWLPSSDWTDSERRRVAVEICCRFADGSKRSHRDARWALDAIQKVLSSRAAFLETNRETFLDLMYRP